MPKEKQKKKAIQLRHNPIGQEYEEKPLKNKSANQKRSSNEVENDVDDELETIPEQIKSKIFTQARDQRMEMVSSEPNFVGKKDMLLNKPEDDSDYDVLTLFNEQPGNISIG